jgi:hypothetical protein
VLGAIAESGVNLSAEERRPFLELIDKHPEERAETEAKISAEELQDVLRFVIDEQHFFEFDSEIAEQEIEAEQERIGVTMTLSDGVTTIIRIQTAERDHTARFYGLYDYMTEYPAVKSLANLLAVQKRLSRLMSEIEGRVR